jgi:hypothetical protein
VSLLINPVIASNHERRLRQLGRVTLASIWRCVQSGFKVLFVPD